MGRAGKALRSVLEDYEISQNKLAVTLGMRRSIVFKWYHEERDPAAETVAEIVKALKTLDPEAARAFIHRYLGQLMEEETTGEQ